MAGNGQKSPFPVQQMIILSICRFAEPVASTSVFPYIPELVASFNVRTDQIGMYSGWLSAVFSLCQAITGIAWGRASDKLGRKPVILFALVTVLVSSVAFGFSTSLTMAFITRSVQGASSGNVGIIRTVVAEIVPQKELQPRAFSIMPLIWNIGSIFGPSIGGFLSNPQRHGWFTDSQLLKKYPFALPNLTISSLFLVGIVSGWLFLKESHEAKRHNRDAGLVVGAFLTSSCSKRNKRQWKRHDDEADPFLNPGEARSTVVNKTLTSTSKSTSQPTWGEIFSRQSTINLVVYTGLAMHSVSFDQLIPVFMHHPTQPKVSQGNKIPLSFTGGFGLDSGRIGMIFTVYGIFGMLVQLFLFPPLARKFGVLNCFKVCVLTFPCVYIAVPFTSLLPTSIQRQGVCLALMLVKGAAGIFAFPCSTILLTNSATSLGILGTLNGVATSISATGRAAGPALCGWAFTYGVDIGYIVIPFWTLFVISVIAAFPVWWLIEMEGPTAKSQNEREEYDLGTTSDEQLQDEDGQELEAVRLTSSLGVPVGTEAADRLENDLSVSQSARRPSEAVKRRNSNFNLRTSKSPTTTVDEE